MEDPGGEVRWKLWAEAFRTWTPLMISICAISLTIFQAASTRRHARLSVQPRLDWRVFQDSDSGEALLKLVNVGLGPAVITDVILSYDGAEIGKAHPSACEEINTLIGRGGAAWDTVCFTFDDEYVLRQDDEIILFGSRPDEASGWTPGGPLDFDASRLFVAARYCSFYEDCWWLNRDGQ